MKLKMSSWLTALVLAAGGVLPVVGPAAPACAADEPHATLVVDTGANTYELCVRLDGGSVSGIDFIELAGEQHNLDYVLGYAGRGVCRLANVPDEEPSERCLDDHEEFWGYWRWDDSQRSWYWSGTGAAGTRVEDGDVEGWAYGAGRSGTTHQKPGPGAAGMTSFSECPKGTGRDKKDPARGGDGNDPPAPDPGTDERPNDSEINGPTAASPSAPGSAPGSKPNKPQRLPGAFPSAEPEPDEHRIDAAPEISELSTTPSPDEVSDDLPASATSSPVDEDDFPLAGALALVATFGMAGVALLLVRKRVPVKPED